MTCQFFQTAVFPKELCVYGVYVGCIPIFNLHWLCATCLQYGIELQSEFRLQLIFEFLFD